MQIGQVHSNGRWTVSSNGVCFPELMSAVKFFAENHLQLSNVVSARVGLGVRELPPLRGFIGATTLLWRPGSAYARIVEQAFEPGQ
eukprot:361216-Lingulodinium_polyedra.AAC.1